MTSDSAPLPSLALDVCASEIGRVLRAEPVQGGNVSRVFRVRGERGSVIVKIRDERFARIPSLKVDPGLFAAEVRVLELLGPLLPTHLPQLLHADPAAMMIVMTDVFPTGQSFAERLWSRSASPDELAALGAALRRIHDVARGVRGTVRSAGDLAFREHTLDFVLRSSMHPVLGKVADELSARPETDLVLGDASPRNFSIVDGRVTFCDLENVHRGWQGYDRCYIAAHIVLHHLDAGRAALDGIEAFFDGYGDVDDPMSHHPTPLIIGILLYRLVPAVVPYDLRFSRQTRETAAAVAARALSTPDLSLTELVGAMCRNAGSSC